MRLSIVFQFLFAFVFLAFGILLLTGSLSTRGIYDAYQRYSSGVVGQPAESNYEVTTSAAVSPLDGYTYAGQLDATITYSDASGAETVFDLHYPTDYNFFHDGFGPLWLANMRPDIADNPQVSPVLGNSCLQTINGENLATNRKYQTGYKEYLVCRVLDEEGPDAPDSYDISKSKPAVIGVIWTKRNQQPIDAPRERCIAEARIWSVEIAKPGDRFMACLFVVSEAPQQVEVYAFELTDGSIVEIGGAKESWPRAAAKAREATRLVQYRLIQKWLSDPQAHDEAVKRAYDHIAANLDKVVPTRVSKFDGVEHKQDTIKFTFRAKDTAEMVRIREKSRHGADRHLYKNIRPLVCGTDERAALLAFQENKVTYAYELNRSNGKPMTLDAAFPNLPC